MNKMEMTIQRRSSLISAVRFSTVACLALTAALSSRAAQRTWTGLGTDALWSTPDNWDSGVPAAADTALFSGSGNGKTAVSLGGIAASAGLTFSANAAAYSIGASGETMNLAANSVLTLSADALNDQTVAATLIPGGNCSIYNNEISRTLFISNLTVTANRYLYIYGLGPVTFDKLQRPVANEETDSNYIRLETRLNAPITCTDRMTIGDLWNYTYPLTLNLAPHTTNIFCRNSWCLAVDRGGTISGGEGTVLILRQTDPAQPGRFAIQNGTVTINVQLSGPAGLNCVSGWVRGTLVLANPANDFGGSITIDRGNCIQVPSLAAVGVAQPLGRGNTLAFTNPLDSGVPCRLRVTGDSPSSTERIFTIDKDRAVIENAGTGLVSLSGSISGAGTLVIDGAGPITYSGDRSGTGGLIKSGAGTLTLTAANSYSGTTAVDGGTLILESGASLGSGALTLSAAAGLSLNPSGAADYSISLPATTVSALARLTVAAPSSGSSTVTFSSLSFATVNSTLSVTAPDAGASNRIFINGLAEGPVGPITLNGGLAAYSSANGLIPYTPASVTHLTTLGPGATVPDDPDGAAVIDSAGTSGPVTLASDLTTLALLSQEHPSDALIDFGGGILAADMVRQTSGAGGLTLQNGALTSSGANSNVLVSGIGTIALSALTDDASTGLSPANTYTHLLDFGTMTGAASINGVVFTKVSTSSGSVSGYGWSGFPSGGTFANWNDWTNNIPPDTGSGLRSLLYDMVYSGANITVKLTGLIPGTVYEFRLYLRTWDGQANAIERTARFDFLTDASAAPVASTTFDMNHNDPTVMAFRYVAATSELILKTYCAANTSNPYPGFFGITNEKLADAPGSLETGRSVLALVTAGTTPVTVDAAVTDSGRTTSLVKEGDGILTLSGPVSHTGTTALNGGTLDLAPTGVVAQTFSGQLMGSGGVIKRGEGSTLFMSTNSYAGLTVISNGILSVGDSSALGLTSAGTSVESGGALALGSAQYNGLVISEPITLSGSGPDGLGALRNDAPSPQLYAFKNLALSDDATVGGTAALPGFPYAVAPSASGRFDCRNGILDFGGHALTKAGPGAFIVSSSVISGVTATAAVNISGGVFGMEATTDLYGSDANTLTVGSATSLDLYQLVNPIRWSTVFEDQSHLTARNNAANSQNILSGPVTLNGTVILDGSYHDTLSGIISGSGGLSKSVGFTHLNGTNNAYAGTTVVSGGLLSALAASSLPAADFSRVTVSGSGILAVRPAGSAESQPGWNVTEIGALIASGAFTARSASLGFETVYEDNTFSDALPTAGVAKTGPQKQTIGSTTHDLGPVTVYDGELEFADAAHGLGTYSVIAGADLLNTSLGTLRLTGTASLLTDDPGYNRSGPLVAAGSGNASRGIICIDDDAAISGRLYLGYGGNNAEGAVYQTGGSFLNTGGSANDARAGISGHGYYEISGGSLTNKGYTQFGVNLNNAGILRQTGGSVVFNSGSTPASGVISDYYGGALAVRAGLGLFHLTSGTFTTGTSKFSLGEWSGENSYNDGTGILTVEGDADASVGYLELANRNNYPLSVVNLDGGSLATRYLQKGGNNNSANSRAYVNFNSGVLKITESGSAIRTSANNSAPVLAVENGGAVFEVDQLLMASVDLPLAPPQGQGLTYIGINSRGAGYIAPPFVNITGGGGYGATAVATIDRATGQLADIRVTSPGTGYTSAPSVSLVGGGYTSAGSVKDIIIGISPSSGGLTKLGTGTLNLTTNNTFSGALTVSGGTLNIQKPEAVPQDANLILDGGVLNLGGIVLSNASVRLSSGGGLINGSVVTAALLKDGAGAADLAAGITLASVPLDADNGTPGLYEGRLANITGNSNRTDPNPRWSVQLTTRAVNGANVGSGGTINYCPWPDNTCYVYTGYLWNRAATNVVWTFGENFDDSVYLVIDGHAILDNNAATTPTYRNVTLTPGPHSFEVRCGQGGGNVGANWVQTSTYRLGFGVDFQGRAQNVADNYQPLVDPGNGSLFTIDLPASYTGANVQTAPDLPELPAEVAANVGALADGYALVYASDVPATGGIINGSVAGTRYSTDNSTSDSNDFDRVAYYVELTHPTYGNQWVWVSFDAVTRDRALIGYPFHDYSAGTNYCANVFQQKVSNMDVKSNVAGITNYVGCATGNIEFWPNDYGAPDALALGANTSTYDFGDTISSGPVSSPGHGSFQIHNWGDKTTLFAMNNWGKYNNTISLGIGNQPSGHPDWTFNYNGTAYTYRRLYVFTRDLLRTPKAPSAVVAEGTLTLASSGITHPVPSDIRDKAGTASDGYDLVYASALPVTCATLVNGTAYSANYSADTTPFDRVAYFMELEHPTYGHQWVWVSFDAYTADRTKLGFPNQTGNLFMWQRKVDNMDVVCNVDGITNYVGCATGNVEIWPSNYSNATVPASGLGGSGSTFDFDDSGGSASSQGHGCFQIHNWGDKVTLLAVSHCGGSGNTLGIGIGNNPQITNNDPDYTFTYNAAQYTVRNFYVFVRPIITATGDALAAVDLTVEAGATLNLGGETQTVHSVTGSGTVSNGVLAAGTVLSPAGDGVVGTLALADIQLVAGTQYRADLGDLLDVTGSLTVSGMSLHLNNPEALDRQQTYTLIQTTAGVTGVPTTDVPLPSAWKLVNRGNTLLLLSEGGTFLFLK